MFFFSWTIFEEKDVFSLQTVNCFCEPSPKPRQEAGSFGVECTLFDALLFRLLANTRKHSKSLGRTGVDEDDDAQEVLLWEHERDDPQEVPPRCELVSCVCLHCNYRLRRKNHPQVHRRCRLHLLYQTLMAVPCLPEEVRLTNSVARALHRWLCTSITQRLTFVRMRN